MIKFARISLLVIFFVQAFFSSLDFSPAFDEVSHIPAGYSYLVKNDYRLNSQHPPLVKKISAIPLLLLDIKVDWNDIDWINPNEWSFGRKFLYSNDYNTILIFSKFVPILIGVLLGVFLYKLGKLLFNERAALFVLFLYAFTPSFIGHTVFVTMDVALACFVIMSFYFGISYCKKRGKKDIILFFLSQSLAIVTKFSAILFLPFFVALLFCSSLSKKEFAKNFLILLGVIFTVVSISYGSIFGINNYFEGLFRVNSDHLRLDTYFAGNFYKERVYLYFIYCYLLKTPIVAILIFLAAIFFILKKYQFRNFELNLLFISAFCFLVIHSLYAAPLGIRYILPTLAITLVLSGIVANHINSKHLLVLAIILLVEVLPTYPNFLGYFNFSIGGNNNGYLYLDDSNLDWGQNLNKLANFQREVLKNQELTVVGSSPVPLQFYNIKVKDAIYLISDFRDTLNKGYFAISPHFLIRASNPNFQNSINWLDKDPIARIGSSFLIYKVD